MRNFGFDAGDFIGADKVEYLQNKPTMEIKLNEVHQTSVAIVNSKSQMTRGQFFGNLTDDKYLEMQVSKGGFNKISCRNRMRRKIQVKSKSPSKLKSKAAAQKSSSAPKRVYSEKGKHYLSNLVQYKPIRKFQKTGTRSKATSRVIRVSSQRLLKLRA